MSATYTDLPFTSFPDSIQSFDTMEDITSTDATYVKLYQEAMQAGDTALANTYYNQITDAAKKIVTSALMNKIAQTITALERFYNGTIYDYIADTQSSWQTVLNRFTFRSTYSASTQYYVNNMVNYSVNGDTMLFICTRQPPVGTNPTNTNYWRQFTVKGDQGASGSGTSFCYAWDSATAYSVNDTVTYNNALWLCVLANTNQVPASGSTYWKMIYSASQVAYPYQSIAPSSPTTGDLWFEVSANVIS